MQSKKFYNFFRNTALMKLTETEITPIPGFALPGIDPL